VTAKGDRARLDIELVDRLRDRADPAALSRSLFAVEVLLTSEPRQAIRGRMFRKA
jgi:hypothetical protein